MIEAITIFLIIPLDESWERQRPGGVGGERGEGTGDRDESNPE